MKDSRTRDPWHEVLTDFAMFLAAVAAVIILHVVVL